VSVKFVPYKRKVISTPLNLQPTEPNLKFATNVEARKARHKRVFAHSALLSKTLFAIPNIGLGIFKKFRKKNAPDHETPTHRLFKSYSIAVAVVFVIGVITPSNANSLATSYASDSEVLADIAYTPSTSFITDQEGYITKINPQTELGDRTSMNGRLVHTVANGETISTIAAQYSLRTNTLLWENGLTANSKIKSGAKLLVPPVDGVSHEVQKGEDLSKVAGLYSVKTDSIAKQNSLIASTGLTKGQIIFVPGGKPLVKEVPGNSISGGAIVRNTKVLNSTSGRIKNVGSNVKVDGSAIGSGSGDSPIGGKPFIMPTRATLTQGFRPGHYAFDLANTSKPPIWATADGVVVKASSGTWGGGYGNHLIIDHGNGLQTLYAHLEYLSVSKGERVKQGQVIGKMGRTGNVRGKTGIHLHFEVHVNGVKKLPSNYF